MKRFRLEIITVTIAAIILISLLMVQPLVGIANNGDFERIMFSAGLVYPSEMTYSDKYFGYFQSIFHYDKNAWLALGGYVSTQVLLVKPIAAINQLFSSNMFDIRVLAAVYSLLLLTAFYYIVKYNPLSNRWTNILFAGILVLVFADVGYTAYFNSLYGEPVSLTFLLLVAAFTLCLSKQEVPSRKLLAGFFIAAVFVVGSKVQNAPVGVLLLLPALRMLQLHKDYAWRKAAIIGTASLILVSAAIYLSAPRSLEIINKYQTVFYGVLKDSPTPKEDLAELGLPPEWSVLANTNYFITDLPMDIKAPAFEQKLREHISPTKIVFFYAKHPLRFWQKMQVAADNGFEIQPSYLGSYEQSVGKTRGALSETFAIWSQFKRDVLTHSIWFILFVYAGFAVVLAYRYARAASPRAKLNLDMLTAIALAGAVQFIVPIIGDGEADLGKHLFLFNVCFDMMLVTGFIWIIHNVFSWFGSPRKNSTTQTVTDI